MLLEFISLALKYHNSVTIWFSSLSYVLCEWLEFNCTVVGGMQCSCRIGVRQHTSPALPTALALFTSSNIRRSSLWNLVRCSSSGILLSDIWSVQLARTTFNVWWILKSDKGVVTSGKPLLSSWCRGPLKRNLHRQSRLCGRQHRKRPLALETGGGEMKAALLMPFVPTWLENWALLLVKPPWTTIPP